MLERKILCSFSGGGYRATFFHAGVLRKLVDMGLKNKIKAVSAVSGGSIVTALFALRFNEIKTVESYDRLIIAPLIELSKQNIRNKILLYKPFTLLNLKSNNEVMLDILNQYLFHNKTLQDLSENIHVIINATNLSNGLCWQFTNLNFGDDNTGFSYDLGNIPIALAVTASSCFPGLFSPLKFNIQEYKFYRKNEYKDEIVSNGTPNFVYLADGGIFDNLGFYSLEQIFNLYGNAVFIVSDAANRFKQNQKKYYFLNEAMRLIDILMVQVANRDSKLMACDIASKEEQGIYIKLENSCRFYREMAKDILLHIPKVGWTDSTVERIAKIRTDLNVFSDSEINALICHGETLVETNIAISQSELYHSRKEPSYYINMEKFEKKVFAELKKSAEMV